MSSCKSFAGNEIPGLGLGTIFKDALIYSGCVGLVPEVGLEPT